MARPQINTTSADFKAAVERTLEAERENGFVTDFLTPLVTAINNHVDTVDLPDDDDLSIAKAEAYVQAHGFGISRIGDRDRNGNCKYRIYVQPVTE